MIPANELRIGNLVSSNINGVNYATTVVMGLHLSLGDYNGIIESFEPIPLTEEWLLKFRFMKTVNEDTFDTWNKNQFEIWQHADGFCHDFHFGDDVETVHQLMNLHFVITGEELIINTTGK